jgi:hypothetical protein
MAVHVAQMTGIDAMTQCYGAVTANAAAAMQIDDYGLAAGRALRAQTQGAADAAPVPVRTTEAVTGLRARPIRWPTHPRSR